MDLPTLTHHFHSSLRESQAVFTANLREFNDPEQLTYKYEACSLLSLMLLIHTPHEDLSDHFDNLAQSMQQYIFFKTDALLSMPAWRRAGTALMILILRCNVVGKPLVARFICGLIIEVSSQMDRLDPDEHVDLLMAMAVRVSGWCNETPRIFNWLSRLQQGSRGRNVVPSIEYGFFEIFNRLLPLTDGDEAQEQYAELGRQTDRLVLLLYDLEHLPDDQRPIAVSALRYFHCWMLFLRCELYMRRGLTGYLQDSLKTLAERTLALSPPLRRVVMGMCRFAGNGHLPNHGFRCVPLVTEYFEKAAATSLQAFLQLEPPATTVYSIHPSMTTAAEGVYTDAFSSGSGENYDYSDPSSEEVDQNIAMQGFPSSIEAEIEQTLSDLINFDEF